MKKLILHLITDKKIVAHTVEDVRPNEMMELAHTLTQWNNSEAKDGLLLTGYEVVIIDMRIPQKEQIEKLIQEALEAYEGKS